MSQTWFRPHPYGVYPRGNAQSSSELVVPRLGTLSALQCAAKGEASKCCGINVEASEDISLELLLHLLSYSSVPELCRLSATCTGWYCLIHASDAFKMAHGFVSPRILRFRGTWKETAIRSYMEEQLERDSTHSTGAKRWRLESFPDTALPTPRHRPVCVKRAFFCDQLFQAWMCTILPCHYHLRLAPAAAAVAATVADDEYQAVAPRANGANVKNTNKKGKDEISTSAAWSNSEISRSPKFTSALNDVPRCSGLSASEFRRRFEEPNLPVVLTDVATQWPLFNILQGKFENLAARREALVRAGVSHDVPMRCEHTAMTLEDYVRYAAEQTDERPIYMFDAEFGASMPIESLYAVPEHFGRDDFFAVLGEARPKYRWIIAGPRRGGSSFHVDPNYTNAWNANLTGRKRWILFPPGCTPAGVFPSEDMSEVATPVSLTEWLLNNYDASVEQWRGVGYECICEPGDIMFVPCGWWHFVINLEDSVAITQNYVSECNLPKVLKFLATMKSSISGIDEDAETAEGAMVARRREGFYEEFTKVMRGAHGELMRRVEAELAQAAEDRRRKKAEQAPLPMLEEDAGGFTFSF